MRGLVTSLACLLLALCAGCDLLFSPPPELLTEYRLVFNNESTNVGSVCVFQHNPDMAIPDVMSLAWFAKGTAPTTTVVFTWSTSYCFVWDEVGEFTPGVVFEAAQTWGADLRDRNCVTLAMLKEEIYTFTDLRHCGHDGSLYIFGDSSLPIKQAAVGIGMAGKPIYAAPAQPNWEWVYTPKPTYWITFGEYEPGEVLDVELIVFKAAIQYPNNVYSMTATLHEDNTWTVEATH